MKIMAVCGSGLGTSFMLEMNIKKILKELNVEAEVGHTDVASVTPEVADIFVMAQDLEASVNVPCKLGLTNIVSAAEIKEKLSAEFAKRGLL